MDDETREPDHILAALERYVAGVCTPDEASDVSRLIASDRAATLLLRDLTAMRVAAKSLRNGWDVSHEWDDMRRRLEQPGVSPTRSASRWSVWTWRNVSSAAMIVLAV